MIIAVIVALFLQQPAVLFNKSQVKLGETYEVKIEGEFPEETRFDALVIEPGSFRETEYQNWLRERRKTIYVESRPANLGTWTITAIRPHRELESHDEPWIKVHAQIVVVSTPQMDQRIKDLMRLVVAGVLVYGLFCWVLLKLAVLIERTPK